MPNKLATVNQGEKLALWDLGVLAQVNINYWSGRKTLTREDMESVGIDPSALPETITNLGRKLLVPREEVAVFNRIEQMARRCVDRWSIPFGIGRANFVPDNVLEDVEHHLKSWQREFMTLADHFVLKFEEMKESIRSEYPDFWKKCLRKHYPETPELLRDKFRFQFFFFRVAGLDTETVAAKEVKEQANLTAQLKAERAREMRVKMQAEVENFVQDAVATMREETIKFCELVTARVNGEPYGDEKVSRQLPPRSISCFRNYIDRFRAMNMFGDNEIDKLLQQFKTDFLPEKVTATDLQSPAMKKAITEHMEKIRKLAGKEDGGMSKLIGQLKRKITL